PWRAESAENWPEKVGWLQPTAIWRLKSARSAARHGACFPHARRVRLKEWTQDPHARALTRTNATWGRRAGSPQPVPPNQEGPMLPIGTILHPTDFSERSGHAYRLACALARDYGANLVILHVAPPPAVAFGDGMWVGPVEPNFKDLKDQLLRFEGPDLSHV